MPREEACSRIIERNGLSAEDAYKRIDSQMSNEERRSHASVDISSEGSKQETQA